MSAKIIAWSLHSKFITFFSSKKDGQSYQFRIIQASNVRLSVLSFFPYTSTSLGSPTRQRPLPLYRRPLPLYRRPLPLYRQRVLLGGSHICDNEEHRFHFKELPIFKYVSQAHIKVLFENFAYSALLGISAAHQIQPSSSWMITDFSGQGQQFLEHQLHLS